jgi:hypothetical protein
MAVGKVWNVSWLNANSQRNYPLHDNASGQDVTGSFTLPNDLLVDMVFPVHMINLDDTLLDLNNFCLRSIAVFAEGVTLTFAVYDGASTYTEFATRTILESAHTRNKSYYIEGLGDEGDPFFDSVGRVTIGTFTGMRNFGGFYTFDIDGGRLLPTVIRPALQTLSGIRFANADGDTSDLLQGDVTIVAGDNLRFDVSGTTVTINATAESDFLDSCECDTAPEGDPIRTINGIGPDSTGNFQMEAVDCITISPITHGIRFADTCAEPCCGCEELNALRDSLENLATQLNGLESYSNRVHGFIQQLQNTLVASVLSTNDGC